jgi:hypothetical protein
MFYFFRIHPVKTHCQAQTAPELAPPNQSSSSPQSYRQPTGPTQNAQQQQEQQEQQEQDKNHLLNHLLILLVQCFPQSRKEQI